MSIENNNGTKSKQFRCPVCNTIGNLVHKGVRDNKDIDVTNVGLNT